MRILIQEADLPIRIAMICIICYVIACLVRAVLGPRFTDRLVAVNMITTQTVLLLCLAAVYIGRSYLIDIAIVYTLISFLPVVVLTRLYRAEYLARRSQGEEASRANGQEEDCNDR